MFVDPDLNVGALTAYKYLISKLHNSGVSLSECSTDTKYAEAAGRLEILPLFDIPEPF